jgi:hypothetical protein
MSKCPKVIERANLVKRYSKDGREYWGRMSGARFRPWCVTYDCSSIVYRIGSHCKRCSKKKSRTPKWYTSISGKRYYIINGAIVRGGVTGRIRGYL